MKKLLRQTTLLCVCTTTLLGINEAVAFPSYGQAIETFCADNNYPLLSEYANDTCDAACHRNSAGQTAYDQGDLTYFCPEPIATGPICTDADNDGFYAEGIDCGTLADFNDNNAAAYPGAVEDCTDGIDNDGNGLADLSDPNAVGCPLNCTDMDGDTYSIDGGECGPIDCDDSNFAVNPGAEESCTDGIDNNCNGLIDTADMNALACPITCNDLDGDGYSIEGGACGAMDCDDTNSAVNPAALEICDDGIDNNCNNMSDAADSVCQTNESDDDDEQQSEPWWRKRSKHKGNDSRRNRHSRDTDDDDRWSYRYSNKRIYSWSPRERDDD